MLYQCTSKPSTEIAMAREGKRENMTIANCRLHCTEFLLCKLQFAIFRLFPAHRLQHPLPFLRKAHIRQEALYMLAVVFLKERRKDKKRALGKLLQIRQAFCIGSIQKLRPLLFLPPGKIKNAGAANLAIGQG